MLVLNFSLPKRCEERAAGQTEHIAHPDTGTPHRFDSAHQWQPDSSYASACTREMDLAPGWRLVGLPEIRLEVVCHEPSLSSVGHAVMTFLPYKGSLFLSEQERGCKECLSVPNNSICFILITLLASRQRSLQVV
jgi:hypothetical protein